MTILDLGNELNRMYNIAPKKEKVASIHLFGIKYGEIILHESFLLKEIITLSGINSSYITELSKGIKLSKYVILRELL